MRTMVGDINRAGYQRWQKHSERPRACQRLSTHVSLCAPCQRALFSSLQSSTKARGDVSRKITGSVTPSEYPCRITSTAFSILPRPADAPPEFPVALSISPYRSTSARSGWKRRNKPALAQEDILTPLIVATRSRGLRIKVKKKE